MQYLDFNISAVGELDGKGEDIFMYLFTLRSGGLDCHLVLACHSLQVYRVLEIHVFILLDSDITRRD